MKVISFGEILWDIIEGAYHIGGAPFNFAAHLTQCGADVAMISRLGKDEIGKRAFQAVCDLSVGTKYLQWDTKHPTGTVNVFLQNGQPTYTIHPEVAYDYIDFENLKLAGLLEDEIDIFSFGTLAQRHEKSRNTLNQILENQSFRHIFYDVNLRKDCYNADIIKHSIPHSTILKLNDDEVSLISNMLFQGEMDEESFARQIAEAYRLEVVIITAGAKGCYIHHDGNYQKIPGRAVKVLDTVGAGDSFSAAFMYQYLHHGDPFKAATIANHVGGFVAASRGAIPQYTKEIRELLANR